MSAETRINRALKRLGEDFRQGAVSPEEYRARRRSLLDSWNGTEADAAQESRCSSYTNTIRLPGPVRAEQPVHAVRRLAMAGLIAAAVLGGVTYMLLASA